MDQKQKTMVRPLHFHPENDTIIFKLPVGSTDFDLEA